VIGVSNIACMQPLLLKQKPKKHFRELTRECRELEGKSRAKEEEEVDGTKNLKREQQRAGRPSIPDELSSAN